MERVAAQLEALERNFMRDAGAFAVAKAKDERDSGFNAEFKRGRAEAVDKVDACLDAYLAIKEDWVGGVL